MSGDFNKWKVHITYEDYKRVLNIYIVREVKGNFMEFVEKIENGLLTIKRAGYDREIKPTIVFSNFDDSILQSLVDEAYKNGFKPKDKPFLENELTATKYHSEGVLKARISKLEGELKAMKLHLSDMRRLMFGSHNNETSISVDSNPKVIVGFSGDDGDNEDDKDRATSRVRSY